MPWLENCWLDLRPSTFLVRVLVALAKSHPDLGAPRAGSAPSFNYNQTVPVRPQQGPPVHNPTGHNNTGYGSGSGVQVASASPPLNSQSQASGQSALSQSLQAQPALSPSHQAAFVQSYAAHLGQSFQPQPQSTGQSFQPQSQSSGSPPTRKVLW
jgi:hypothetical protein